MPHTTRTRVLLVLVAAFIGLGAAPPAMATENPPPGLSITIDNGRKSIAPRSDVTYATTVSNSGLEPVTTWVVVTVPSFATIKRAKEADVKGPNATWKIELEPGTKRTLTTAAKVGSIPDGLTRVTSLASVYLTKHTTGAPVIRSADADRIPGVAEPASPALAVTSKVSTSAYGTAPALWSGAGLVALGAVCIGLVVASRRRRSRRVRTDQPLS